MTLTEAQTAVAAMLNECGLSQVIISADGKHNRYSVQGCNIYYTFDDLGALHEAKKPAPKMVQVGMFE